MVNLYEVVQVNLDNREQVVDTFDNPSVANAMAYKRASSIKNRTGERRPLLFAYEDGLNGWILPEGCRSMVSAFVVQKKAG